jgi:carboxyl-terminal processing protease
MFILIPGHSLAESSRLAWISNDDMLLFHEAVEKIQLHALNPEKANLIVQGAIRSYLRQFDRYSDYLTREEYTSYVHSQEPRYSGVGMDIFRDHEGQLVCVPFPGKAADHAGIQYGDVLIGINGKNLSEKSVFSVGSMLRGPSGERVTLTVKRKSGDSRSLSVVRRTIDYESVFVEPDNPLPILRILRFSSNTCADLKSALVRVGLSKDKILDLRGNTGGELSEAVEAASLFLDPGAKVITVQTQSKRIEHVVKSRAIDRSSRIFIWQDRFTASAAEVFTAAMKHNRRAATLGTRSFGKGYCQKFLELSDGSVILISYGSLIAPNGYGFDRKGLDPDHLIKWQPGDPDIQFVTAVSRLLKR